MHLFWLNSLIFSLPDQINSVSRGAITWPCVMFPIFSCGPLQLLLLFDQHWWSLAHGPARAYSVDLWRDISAATCSRTQFLGRSIDTYAQQAWMAEDKEGNGSSLRRTSAGKPLEWKEKREYESLWQTRNLAVENVRFIEQRKCAWARLYSIFYLHGQTRLTDFLFKCREWNVFVPSLVLLQLCIQIKSIFHSKKTAGTHGTRQD